MHKSASEFPIYMQLFHQAPITAPWIPKLAIGIHAWLVRGTECTPHIVTFNYKPANSSAE
jgi:hypothetical protein